MTNSSATRTPGYRHQRTWSIVGWLLLLAVVTLSLVSIDQPIAVAGADKYEHVLAYSVLMFWWGMVQPHRRLAWAVALTLLGASLEGIQQFTPDRFMEWRDAVANLAGVVLGLSLVASPAGRLLGWLDGQIANRLDPGRP